VGEGLSDHDIVLGLRSRGVHEQVQRAKDIGPHHHGKGVHGVEAGIEGQSGEARPGVVVTKVVVHDGLTATECVEARALLVLDLEVLEDIHRLARRRHHLQQASTRHRQMRPA
jgi:hypothetical protein